MENIRRPRKKHKKTSLLLVLIIVLIIVGIIYFLIYSKKENIKEDELIGTWTTDGVTIYEFDGKGKGSLKLPTSEYKFSYVLNENKIYIDFESEKATDSDYEYLVEGNKLTLKGIKTTTGSFIFNKQ